MILHIYLRESSVDNVHTNTGIFSNSIRCFGPLFLLNLVLSPDANNNKRISTILLEFNFLRIYITIKLLYHYKNNQNLELITNPYKVDFPKEIFKRGFINILDGLLVSSYSLHERPILVKLSLSNF